MIHGSLRFYTWPSFGFDLTHELQSSVESNCPIQPALTLRVLASLRLGDLAQHRRMTHAGW